MWFEFVPLDEYCSTTINKLISPIMSHLQKKILFIITKSNFGGAQKYVFELATNLPKDQFEPVVALGGDGILIQKLHAEHVRVLPIFSLTRDVSIGSDLFAFFELWSMFRKEKPDVVHLNSAKAGGVGALAGRLARVPKIIFTAHGWAFNEDRSRWQRALIKLFSWITVLLAHETIAVSDAVKNDTKKWPFVSKKMSVIKNGIKEPKFYTREDARGKLIDLTGMQIPEDAFIVGTIAELHKNKGLSYAIEAFAELAPSNPNLYYFILGGGEEKERLEALVGLHGLQGRVIFVGFVDNAVSYLRAFDVFLLPSITEGLALVLIEAGFAGLPVIASRVGGIPEVIEDAVSGLLVDARDPHAIALATQSLMEQAEKRLSFAEELHRRVSQNFSLTRVLTEIQKLYTKNEGAIINKCKE